MLYFEDIQVGDYKESTEDYELTAEEIIETVIEFKAAALIRQRPQES